MSDLDGLAIAAVALKHLEDKVKERRAKVNAELADEMTPGDRKTAALNSGTAVGSVTFTKGRASGRVVDEAALLAWVRDNHPDEVVESVRPSYRAFLLDLAKRNGVAADPDTGEIIPGVELTFTDPYLSVKPDAAQLPALVAAIHANGLLALEGGES